jgi:hypothetical protein
VNLIFRAIMNNFMAVFSNWFYGTETIKYVLSHLGLAGPPYATKEWKSLLVRRTDRQVRARTDPCKYDIKTQVMI